MRKRCVPPKSSLILTLVLPDHECGFRKRGGLRGGRPQPRGLGPALKAKQSAPIIKEYYFGTSLARGATEIRHGASEEDQKK